MRPPPKLCAGLVFAAFGCAAEFVPAPGAPPPPSRAITDLDALPGLPCGDPLMVIVTFQNPNNRFCIDRFESSVDGADLGNVHQAGGDDTLNATDGSTLGVATTDLAATPAVGLSFYQALAVCQNAGKRLCSQTEWERACRGVGQLIYPYGDNNDETICNGFFNYADLNPQQTGSFSDCGNAFGVYDLSGNVAEWVNGAAERQVGSGVFDDRFTRGGSFKSNENALRCIGDEFHAPPTTVKDDLGFRCCMDVPPGL